MKIGAKIFCVNIFLLENILFFALSTSISDNKSFELSESDSNFLFVNYNILLCFQNQQFDKLIVVSNLREFHC